MQNQSGCEKSMKLYSYAGPVMVFDKCVAHSWYGRTRAESERKARNNLRYQYCNSNNLNANAKVGLPGNLIMIEED